MATTKKVSSNKSTKFQFSWLKLLFGFSLALNIAFVVFVISLLRTTYLDMSLQALMIGRDYDQNGCFKIIKDNSDGTKTCFIFYTKDKGENVTSPKFLKGIKAPQYPNDYQ